MTALRREQRDQQRETDETDLHGVAEHEHVREQPRVGGVPHRQQPLYRE
jgi:hypothetical protein